MMMIILSTPQQAAELLKQKQLIEDRLDKTGRRKEYEDALKEKLSECGWKAAMRKHCMGTADG